MQAIVSIAGQQFKVEEGQEIFVHQLAAEKGEQVAFSEVLMTQDGDKVAIGTPTLGLTVKAEVLDHLKSDKVIVFKKKRRKGYRKKNGHKQAMSKIRILSIA
jgi:large subunit ribosomal protein L21